MHAGIIEGLCASGKEKSQGTGSSMVFCTQYRHDGAFMANSVNGRTNANIRIRWRGSFGLCSWTNESPCWGMLAFPDRPMDIPFYEAG
jgi:hypothetical protein